jgi:diguanylate cyclase (GGDEF)-like protein
MDTASRWGGDEFLILMPDSDIKSAEILKKRIKKNNYSISIGSAVWKKGISFKEIIKKADKEMYREKTKKRLNLKKLGLFYYSFFC